MWLLLGCVSLDAGPSPEERLDAVRPGLARAVAGYTDDLEAVAEVVEAADIRLARMLLPAPSGGVRDDARGEAAGVDLWSARIAVEGSVLTGEIDGEGIGEHGASLLLDTRGGPSPDLRLDFGPETVRALAMDGWSFAPAVAVPGESFVSDTRVRFRVDLAAAGRFDPRHAGAATAAVQSAALADFGPAGTFGPARTDAVALLVDLVRAGDAAVDPDLSVAVALGFAPWRARVADAVVATVHADARAWLAYGVALDGWLAERDAAWSLGALPAMGKLFWAWPAGEGVLYGAFPAAWETAPLDAELYRHLVPDVATLERLRDGLPLHPTLRATAEARDAAVWDDLTYRAADAGMEALCDQKALPLRTCAAWASDRRHGRTLGPVAGRPVPMHKGASATLQVERWDDEGDFVGDCAIATTVGMAGWQAVGIAPLALGYAGPSWDWPTHNLPLWLDGDTFEAPQLPPSSRWDAHDTFAYVVVPALDARNGFTLGWDPAGWAHGGSVVGSPMSYAELGAIHREGVELSEAFGWVEDGFRGGWPSF